MKQAAAVARVDKVNRARSVQRTKNCPRRAAPAAPNRKEAGLFGKNQKFAGTRQRLGLAAKLLAGFMRRAIVS